MLEKIRILGVDYQVVSIDNPGLHGLMVDKDCLICIASDTDQVIGTLIHEILEVGVARLELELTHPQISQLDAFLTQVLLDNKQLCKVLVKGAK